MTETPTLPPRVPNPCPGCHRSIYSKGHRVTTAPDGESTTIYCPERQAIFHQHLLLPAEQAVRPQDLQISLL